MAIGDIRIMRIRLIKRTAGAGRAGHLRYAGTLAVVSILLSACGGGSLFGSSSIPAPTLVADDDTPTISERFNQLLGRSSPSAAPAQAVDGVEIDCPVVKIRAGASTFAVGAPGKPAAGSDLRYQATITRTARDCTRSGNQITARIGIEGRVISGPAGAPPAVEIPLRVAVVQAGVQERTIATKVFRTTVSMSEGNVPYSLVGEDLVYESPPGRSSDAYIFYIGFDPQALTPEAPARKPARKK
jgi:hypothetical protein